MKLDGVMAAYRHRPFRRLILRTESGQEYPVNHPEGMTTSEDGAIVGLILANHDFALIEVAAIKEIVALPSRPSRSRRESGS